MKHWCILSVLSVLILFSLFSSNQLSAEEKKSHDTITVRLELSQVSTSLSLSDKYLKKSSAEVELNSGLDNDGLDASRNGNYLIGASVTYNSFSIGGATSITKGSSNSDLYSSYAFKNSAFEFLYQQYKWFQYLDSNMDPVRESDGSIKKLENMEMLNTKLNFFWFFFDDFSFEQAYIKNNVTFSEMRWSPYIKVSPGYFAFKNNSPVVPTEKRIYYDASCRDVSEAQFYILSVSAGLAFIIPFDSFYISPMISMGGQAEYHRFNGELGWQKGARGDLSLEIRLLAAFSFEGLLFGGYFWNESMSGKIGNMYIIAMNLNVTFFGAVRF